MRTREILREARKLGREAGHAAATWVVDGNTSDETKQMMREGIEDGDPEVLDMLRIPNLSGEWGDEPTPSALYQDIGFDQETDKRSDWLSDQICTDWEDAASEAFFTQLREELK